MDFGKILNKYYWEELEKEGITQDDVSIVNLDIAFSPVTPFSGCHPCEVTETTGGEKYIVHAPTGAMTVDKEALRVMRYRYLQFDPERIRQREQVRRIFGQY